ncbi:hypothetical protein O3P69_007209 [Scylla paramamosain]|uniref:Mutator-like transposase domain-containing protein n=1 Tax=Scylla paramamosain TaxID=85552 RepID=A0AAW0V3A3_SCYPA
MKLEYLCEKYAAAALTIPASSDDTKEFTEVNLILVYHTLVTNQEMARFDALAEGLHKPAVSSKVKTKTIPDLEVSSNFCSACSIQETKGPDSLEEYITRHHCQKNFDGASGAMEVEVTVRIWERSTNSGFRYVTFIGYGDSAAYRGVCSLNNTTPKVNEEFINHASKRLGFCLRKLKKENFVTIMTMKGKTMKKSLLGGAHQLTPAFIEILTSTY